MNRYLRLVLLFIGIGFLIFGFIGLFIPILQGILFLVIGIYLLSLTSQTFKDWSERHMLKFPKIHHHYHKHKGRVDKLFKKRGGE